MAKISNYIAIIWLLGSLICCEPSGRDRNIIHNNVIDTVTTVEIDTIEEINVRQGVVDTLLSYVGIKELTGNNDGPEVEMFIESTGLDPKGEYPWCAAFITYGFKVNGLEVPKYPARAASWFDSEHVISSIDAIEGDLGSLYYQRLGRIGHIVAYTKPFDNPTPYAATVEGNTNAEGSPEGDQVAKRFRPKAVIHSSSNWIDYEYTIK